MVSVTSRVRKKIGRLVGNNTVAKPKLEVLIVSHPKCGRTWLAVMISRALNDIYALGMEGEFSLTEITTRIAMKFDRNLRVSAFHHDSSCFRRAHRFSYLRHDDKKDFAKKHVVLLVRDPRDVLVSSYHQIVERDKNYHDIEPDLSKFIRDDAYGIRKLLAFYESWGRNRHVPLSFSLLRYEDMHRDPAEALKTVLEVMNVKHTDVQTLRRAVDGATFEKMQKMEREGTYKAGAMAHTGEGNLNAMKARKGKIGSYADELSPDDVDYLNEAIRKYGCAFYERDELFPAE